MKLIGGQKLKNLGSDRHTDDTDYLINDPTKPEIFEHYDGVDIVNAANHPFYNEVWDLDVGSDDVSLQALLEMSVFTFVQHCENGQWEKADAKEYDIKFLVRKLLSQNESVSYDIAKKYISPGAIVEVDKIIASVRV